MLPWQRLGHSQHDSNGRILRVNELNQHSFYATVDPEGFWNRRSGAVVIDVRSPSEFEHGHIPGAVNLPLFDDDQRSEVGTIYKNSGHDSAVLRGLKFAGEKMADLVVQARELAGGETTVLVHCWRGGMRSQSMGWLLKTAGLNPIVLDGGYKAFRRFAREFFDRDWQLQVVSGLTGAGKTRVLQLLADAGQQVIDLEGLANHRGSAFGGIGQSIQPTTEQFENDLFARLEALAIDSTVWLEDEGNRIGTVVLPNSFYHLMRHSPAVFMDSSPDQRVENLLVDYGDLPIDELEKSISKIRKRLGPQHAEEAIAALKENNVRRAIEVVLAYYDKTYHKAASSMPRTEMPRLAIDNLADDAIIRATVAIADSIELPENR